MNHRRIASNHAIVLCGLSPEREEAIRDAVELHHRDDKPQVLVVNPPELKELRAMHRPAANVLKTVLAVAGVGAAGVSPQPSIEPVDDRKTVDVKVPFAYRTHSRNKRSGPRSQKKRRLIARRRNQV